MKQQGQGEHKDNSGRLFDHIKAERKLPTDSALAVYLGEHQSLISAIRHGRLGVHEKLLARIVARTRISERRARELVAAVAP